MGIVEGRVGWIAAQKFRKTIRYEQEVVHLYGLKLLETHSILSLLHEIFMAVVIKYVTKILFRSQHIITKSSF